MALLTVVHVSELSPGEAWAVEVGGRAIALFRRDEGWYAIDNTCPHRGHLSLVSSSTRKDEPCSQLRICT